RACGERAPDQHAAAEQQFPAPSVRNPAQRNPDDRIQPDENAAQQPELRIGKLKLLAHRLCQRAVEVAVVKIQNIDRDQNQQGREDALVAHRCNGSILNATARPCEPDRAGLTVVCRLAAPRRYKRTAAFFRSFLSFRGSRCLFFFGNLALDMLCLQIAAQRLLALNRLEQRLEVALSEAAAAFALDQLEK